MHRNVVLVSVCVCAMESKYSQNNINLKKNPNKYYRNEATMYAYLHGKGLAKV